MLISTTGPSLEPIILARVSLELGSNRFVTMQRRMRRVQSIGDALFRVLIAMVDR